MKNHPVFSLISDEQTVSQLAQELTDEYIGYFDVDISHEQEQYRDAIEECLAHLEEVSSTLEDLTKNKATVDAFTNIVDSKKVSLSKLYAQVDAIEQYIFQTNRLFDEMEVNLSEMERHQRSRGSKIKQFINMIPGITTVPRLSLFSNFIPDNINAPSDYTTEPSRQRQLIPIEELLVKIHQVDLKLSKISNELNQRLNGNIETTTQKPEVDESMATLSLDAEGNVDGSWQELL